MIKLFLLFLLPITLFGSKILSYNIYDRTDRVDVMITFDTPYTGVIKKSKTKTKIIIKLQDTSIESSKLKQISSKFLSVLSIIPMPDHVKIIASVPNNIALKASKTSDAYGLRLRFQDASIVTKKQTTNTNNTKQTNNSFLASLPTKEDDVATNQYYIVVSILIIGIIILFAIKKKVSPINSLKTQKQPQRKQISDDNVSIRFQKGIDDKNSVVMLDFMEQSYLVMMGTNNVLLDKFNENKPNTQEDFESILQDKHQVLEEFLSQKEQLSPIKEEPYKSYSQRASTIS